MHLADGILGAPLLAGTALVGGMGVVRGLRMMKPEDIPQTAVLSSAFFIASLIHIPIGPVSGHLMLNGLMGVLLGWRVFPAMLIALVLQAVLFYFGGITVLGVNLVIMALPALVVWGVFGGALQRAERVPVVSALAGMVAVVALGLSAVLVTLCLYSAGKALLPVAAAVLVAHLPVMVVEAFVTAAIVVFIKRVRPDMLDDPWAGPAKSSPRAV